MLNNSIEYEINRKEHSDALLVGGILSYPDSKEFYYVADGAHDAHILSNNLTNNGIDTVTLFEKDGVMPSPLECTYPLNYENFHRELNKNYDFIYSFGHGGYSMVLWTEDINNNGLCDEPLTEYDIFIEAPKKLLTGFYFMDGCHSMRVESDTDSTEILHIQDFMISGMNCAGLATTREHVINHNEPEPSIASIMFSKQDQSLIISKEFYETAAKLIFNNISLADYYIYCYLGDPSLRLAGYKGVK